MGRMPYKSLADFLEELAHSGELARVSAEVDPHLEIAEITRRVAADGGPALLFDSVRGQSIAVVTNLLGTDARACRALDIESLDGIAERIESLVAEHTPQNWFDRLKMTADESGADRLRPRTLKSGVCQQVVHLGRDVNLATFPLVQAWPGETGPSITATLVTENRQTQTRGASTCPLVALDENRLAVVDDGHSVFARHWADHQAAGLRMPVAIVLGGDPAATIAASLDLPSSIDAYQACGLLRGKAVDVVKCRTHALEVPAEADLVFEGYLDPEVSPVTIAAAGAGATHFRTPRPAPVFHVAAITHRTRPIFPALVDSGSAGEAAVLVKARERMLRAALASVAPDVVDLHLPVLGGSHRFAFVSMRKRYPFHARQVAAALWGTEALKFTKFLILVDHGVQVHDLGVVLKHVGANVLPERDVFAFDGPVHGSDHAVGPALLARHLAIDATAKLAGEQPGGWPGALEAGEEIRQLVTARWAEYKLELLLQEA
jgi:4-hydroxy-3-polyprenylbenzoate decarboxylase